MTVNVFEMAREDMERLCAQTMIETIRFLVKNDKLDPEVALDIASRFTPVLIHKKSLWGHLLKLFKDTPDGIIRISIVEIEQDGKINPTATPPAP